MQDSVTIATHADRLGVAAGTPSVDSPGYRSVALVEMHSGGPGGRTAGTAELQSLLGQRLSHRISLHQPHLTQRRAMDTVGLRVERERSQGHLLGFSPAPAAFLLPLIGSFFLVVPCPVKAWALLHLLCPLSG